MQTLVRQTKPKKAAADAATVEISIGKKKVVYFTTKKLALGLAKQSVLRIGTPDVGAPKVTRHTFRVQGTKRYSRNVLGAKPHHAATTIRGHLTRASDQQIAYVKSLKDAEGGAWTSAEFEQITGISREALRQRRNAFTIVYWTDVRGHSSYPKWQFDSNLQVLPEIREILALLRTHDTMHVLTTFLVPSIGEAGESVLQFIRSGRGREAIEHVRKIVNDH